jgi:hypothetical protein
MSVLGDFKKHWFVTMLCILSALVFVGALVMSSVTYVEVIDAREGVTLAAAQESAEVTPEGSLKIGVSIELRNPSVFELDLYSVSWSVVLDISDLGGVPNLPLANVYQGSGEALNVAAGETRVFEFETEISDEAALSALVEYVSYWNSHGEDYTLETIPYAHDFRVVLWLGDFSHNYQYSGEQYLNDMVRIDLTYSEGEYL